MILQKEELSGEINKFYINFDLVSRFIFMKKYQGRFFEIIIEIT